MAIWPFNRRKQQNQTIPPEVEEYYQSERRERVGMAWLLAALSLLATVLVVLALYFGGRWIWNKVNDDNDNGTTTTQTETDQEQQTAEDNPSDQPVATDESEEPAPDDADVPVSSDDSAETPDALPSDSGSEEPDSQGAAGREDLADTGPGETVAAFIGISAAGALAHNLYSRRKLTKN